MELDRNMTSPTESVIRWNFELEHSGADLSKRYIIGYGIPIRQIRYTR